MKICVLGSGTWGSVLANLLASYKNEVYCWSKFDEEANLLNKTHVHKNLPNVTLNKSIVFSSNMEECVKDAHLVVFAVPSSFIRTTANEFKKFYNHQLLVDVAKGIENESFLTTSEIIEDVLNIKNEVVALTGPTHAEEVALMIPTCIVASCENEEKAMQIQKIFHSECFRVYTNNDRKGSELCGAFKNIIAIACGISDGLGYGDNTKAALITRGVHELKNLGEKMNCNKDTFSGLAGLGDLIVTCASKHSRNNTCGHYIGEGIEVNEAIKKVGMVVEGIASLNAAVNLCSKYNIDMPIVLAVNEIVNNKKPPREVATKLLLRGKKSEYVS